MYTPNIFLSTLSLRRATSSPNTDIIILDISIHALLAESDAPQQENGQAATISIHALLAESDGAAHIVAYVQLHNFYPRSPCGERPSRHIVTHWAWLIFLSTLSLRRATQCRTFANGMYGFLSTLSLRRATQALSVTGSESQFLSTLSLRRATDCGGDSYRRANISIHALLAESDGWYDKNERSNEYFYPRSPCGERRT